VIATMDAALKKGASGPFQATQRQAAKSRSPSAASAYPDGKVRAGLSTAAYLHLRQPRRSHLARYRCLSPERRMVVVRAAKLVPATNGRSRRRLPKNWFGVCLKHAGETCPAPRDAKALAEPRKVRIGQGRPVTEFA